MIARILAKQLTQSLSRQAAVALLGPRQVGKTTLALKSVRLVLFPNDETWAIEIKHSSVPWLKKGFYYACEDVRPTRQFLVYTGSEEFPFNDKVIAISLTGLMNTLARV